MGMKVSLMSRTTVAWIALGLVALAAGCRMCASPYDYCSPTFTGACGEDCAPFARAGSILSGPVHGPPLPPEGYVGQQVPEQQEIARLEVDEETASPIIASVPEKKVEEAPDLRPTPAVEEGPTPAVEQGPVLAVEEGPTLAIEFDEQPSDGWKAVERRSETVRQ